jgi:alpha-amylase/alpha-mannosidase (GH57 family)
MDRYLCIHCHFYQPPRENPWLEIIEQQDSAYPYHDWNERINAECYAPNAASRILTADNRITRIVNNYSRISFNVGPTLLSWMADRAPETYQAILAADLASQERFSGHGSAIAQVYNHMIMPLANRRDKQTQVVWGLRDFQDRFHRDPEGMWLAETAVDIETLEVLAANDIKFTVLAPSQAKAERRVTTAKFKNVDGGKIDPTRPYVCNLPSGRSINLFFYDGPIARAVAFEGLLSDGERFANRLVSGFTDRRGWKQLMHIATDGETYGHHHNKGEMALTYALHHIESKKLAQLTNYGEYLTINPPTHEVEIVENTAWSCSHGVGRWSSNCGCNSGGKPGWNQSWRAPLRKALDHLRDSLVEPYETKASKFLTDPWLARDEYIGMVLDRSEASLNKFLATHGRRALSEAEVTTVVSLLEMQRHAMLMYTSCGWFFDELSGLETVQVIMYAGRTLQLAQRLFPDHHEETFRGLLQSAKSNLPEFGDGAQIFDRFVKPAQVSLLDVAAHYAIASMYQLSGSGDLERAYELKPIEDVRLESGKAHLALGAISVRSRITRIHRDVCFGVLHFGDHNIMAGARDYRDEADFRSMVREMRDSIQDANLPDVVRQLDRHFSEANYTLKSLFRDERQKVVSSLLSSTMDEVEASYRLIYERHAPLMGFLGGMGAPLPKMLHFTAEFVLNTSLRSAFNAEELNVERIKTLIETAEREKIQWDSAWLAYSLTRRFGKMADELALKPREELLHRFNLAVDLVRSLPFEVDLSRVQNVYYQLQQNVYPVYAGQDDTASAGWINEFTALGEKLGFVVEPIPAIPAS